MTTTEEKTIQQLHTEAMDLADSAFFKRRKELHSEAKKLFKQAFAKEKEAAMQLKENVNCEPTRSVLFRSAGWMAMDAEMYQAAFEMAVEGKRFCTHSDLKEELEDLYELAKSKK